jgi:hypothetical protein
MGSADLRRCHAHPFRIEPEGGQVSEYGSKSSKNPSCSGFFVQSLSAESQTTVSGRREEPFDIFDHHQLGSEDGYGVGHVQPQARAGSLDEASALAGGGHVGAREAAGEDVDGPVESADLEPVDAGDVAEVGHRGPVVGEDLRGVLRVLAAVLVGGLVLGVPDDVAAEDSLDGHVEGACSGEQGADAWCAVHGAPRVGGWVVRGG